MKWLPSILSFVTWSIYVAAAAMVFYFPGSALISSIGRESRLFAFPEHVPAEDSLLLGLALALGYAVTMALRRKLDNRSSQTPGAVISEDD